MPIQLFGYTFIRTSELKRLALALASATNEIMSLGETVSSLESTIWQMDQIGQSAQRVTDEQRTQIDTLQGEIEELKKRSDILDDINTNFNHNIDIPE